MREVEVRTLARPLVGSDGSFPTSFFCLGPASCLPLPCRTVRKWTLCPAQTPGRPPGRAEGKPGHLPRLRSGLLLQAGQGSLCPTSPPRT